MIEIARITTFATANRSDIVRRLMGTCDSFYQDDIILNAKKAESEDIKIDE